MLFDMAAKMVMKRGYLQYVEQLRGCDILNVLKAAAFMQSRPHFIVVIIIEEVKMLTLGPHTIIHVSDDGVEQEIHVTFNLLGQQIHDLGEGVDYEDEVGEVLLEFQDGKRRLSISGDNSLALVGVGIMTAEAYIQGICLREGGRVYRHLLGDCDEQGRMFV